jgi:hypothetical protein
MINILFSVSICSVLLIIYFFAFRFLPGERWQVFASIPVHKNVNGRWRGVNITYYGIILSTGYVFAMVLFFILASSAGETWITIGGVSIGIMALFIPAAKIMAYIVERKKNTITVGGASFVMFAAAPWIIKGYNLLLAGNRLAEVNEIVIIASLTAAYAIGEGIGRLACISFGCCYGKPVSELPLFFREIFSKWNFIFSGHTKKISYHDHLDGSPVVPVQGITAVLYTVTACISVYLFFNGNFIISFFVSLTVTQGWRFLSEFLRSDYRGCTKISAYQLMSLFLIFYYAVYIMIFNPSASVEPVLYNGLVFIWDPALFILLGAMWTGSLLYTGISSVTAAEISLYVVSERI